MKKNNQGFTLVELIVVIAILGILAAVAIPVYSGYINKANEAADLTQLDAIKTAAVFAATEDAGSKGLNVETIVVTVAAKAASAISVSGKDGDGTTAASYTVTDDAKVLLGNTFPTFTSTTYSTASKITWTSSSNKWTPSK